MRLLRIIGNMVIDGILIRNEIRPNLVLYYLDKTLTKKYLRREGSLSLLRKSIELEEAEVVEPWGFLSYIMGTQGLINRSSTGDYQSFKSVILRKVEEKLEPYILKEWEKYK